MRYYSKILMISVIFFNLTGCPGKTVLLKNEAGDIAKCQLGPFSGGISRDLSITNCVKEYEAAGYKKISE